MQVQFFPKRLKAIWQNFYIKFSIRRVCGVKNPKLHRDSCVVCSVMRNSEIYINSFIQHYLNMGVSHIFLLDNGSTDRTIEFSSKFKQVTVLSCKLPFGLYKQHMRRYLVQEFGRNRWSLCVDIDELFDFPFSDRVSLKQLLDYLSQHSYTALLANMLDMFACKKQDNPSFKVENELKSHYPCYDLSELRSIPYEDWRHAKYNVVPAASGLRVFQGGVREKAFAHDVGHEKHPLLFFNGQLELFPNSHGVGNARIADLSGVLFHYKFTYDMRERFERAAREGQYFEESKEYKKALQVLRTTDELVLVGEKTKKLENTNELIAAGFLSISDRYRQYAEECQRKSMSC